MHVRSSEIAEWIRARVAAAGARGLVVHLDGGIDSAVVAGLCQRAMPERVAAIVAPAGAGGAGEPDARAVAEHFRIPVVLLDLQPVHDHVGAALQAAVGQIAGTDPGAADAGLRAAGANLDLRLRMGLLYYVADLLGHLVAGTLNRCDLTTGLFTRHGDGGADIFPIGSLLASDVRAFARDLDVPDWMIQRPSGTRLRPGDDEGDLRFTYEHLERYLTEGPEAVAPAMALRIERLIRSTAHKRIPLLTPESEI